MLTKKVLRFAVATACLGAAAGATISLGGATAASGKDGPLYGVLTGANEVSPTGQKKAGDPDGKGSASAIYDEGKLCFALTVKNIGEPTGAHIHRGTSRKNGAVVVPLTPPADGDPGASSGCVDVAADVARSILRNPHRFYWNVHTAEYPAGAIRGQVFARSK